MYGDVAGSWLAVLPRGPAGYGAPQWNRTGLQSSAWLRGAVTLSAPPEQPFKVVFRAARTPDFDLALDSVSIRLGPCSPCGTGCDFDSLDDPCGWQNPPGTGGASWGQWVGAGDEPGVGPQDDFSKPGRVTGADLGTPLLNFQGDQGADWQRRVVNYTGTNEIQFVLQGSYAEKPEPGLAVDSVRVWPCEETFNQCDFNNASDPLCGWAQPDNDTGSWIRTNQPTPTEETRAPGDYPHGEGYYIYAEAGSLQLGQSVSLGSRYFCTADAVCVEFYYYMAGIVETGTQLRVLARGPSGPALPLWTRTGLQSPAWLLGSATVPAGRLQPTWIVFEVVRGNLPYLDMALDNVSVRRGTCPGAPVTPPMPGSSPAGTARPTGTTATATVATGTTPTGTMATATVATGTPPHWHHGNQPHSNGVRPHFWVSSPLCDPIDSARNLRPVPPERPLRGLWPGLPPKLRRPPAQLRPPRRPGCFYHHAFYQPGEVIYAEGCQEICQCLSNNNTRCSDPSCRPDQYCPSHGDGVQGCFPIDSAICMAAGDPHYTTFDKRKFDFQGTCTYVLAQPCKASLALAPFAVHAANEPRHGQGTVSYVRAVFVELPGATVALLKNCVVQPARVSAAPARTRAGARTRPAGSVSLCRGLHGAAQRAGDGRRGLGHSGPARSPHRHPRGRPRAPGADPRRRSLPLPMETAAEALERTQEQHPSDGSPGPGGTREPRH